MMTVRARVLAILLTVSLCGCGAGATSDAGKTGGDSQAPGTDSQPSGNTPPGTGASGGGDPTMTPTPNPDAFWENDPPPMYCGPDDAPTPTPPGGTPDCPDDKNREGCPCYAPGEQAACWPGQRANRGRGQCKDGVTTCTSEVEFGGTWGPCEGYVLPTEGATTGKAACSCFSNGRWALENISPCIISDGVSHQVIGAVSTTLTGSCPKLVAGVPTEHDGQWTENTLKVDCAGQFELCYTVKAGDIANPKPDDCVIASVCTQAWYPEAGLEMALPTLDGWTSDAIECAGRFSKIGGYGEMTVLGESIECDDVDDGSGHPYVFNRIEYCAGDCPANPNRADCVKCRQDAAGNF